jgi:hypothetical protein
MSMYAPPVVDFPKVNNENDIRKDFHDLVKELRTLGY